MYQVGSSCIYVVFIASNLKPVSEWHIFAMTLNRPKDIFSFISYFSDLWSLYGHRHGLKDVHGIHIVTVDIDLLDKEFKTPGTVLVHRQLFDPSEFLDHILLHLQRGAVVWKPRTGRNHQEHTSVLRYSALCYGSHWRGKCEQFRNKYNVFTLNAHGCYKLLLICPCLYYQYTCIHYCLVYRFCRWKMKWKTLKNSVACSVYWTFPWGPYLCCTHSSD